MPEQTAKPVNYVAFSAVFNSIQSLVGVNYCFGLHLQAELEGLMQRSDKALGELSLNEINAAIEAATQSFNSGE
jgi:hypothetical protein